MKIKWLLFTFLYTSTLFSCIDSLNQPFFLIETVYRPTYFKYIEPRIACPYLSTFDLSWSGGDAWCARNGCSEKISLKTFSHAFPDPFSHISLFDLRASWIQNVNHGLFMGIDSIVTRLIQVTATTGNNQKYVHPGDTRLMFGWTHNYIDTQVWDYIDFTCATGILFPTSSRATKACPISTGFNKTWAGLLYAAGSLGIFDWLTFGITADSLLFGGHHPRAQAVWEIATYLKADHTICGLSLLLGYSFERTKQKQTCILNTDRHVFNMILEWDGQTHAHPHRPRIQMIYNRTISGKNIISISILGGLLAFDVVIRY